MKDNKKTVAQMGACLVIIGTLVAICTALYHLIQNMRAKKLVSEGELKNLYNDIKSYENRLKSLKKELDGTIREYKKLQSTYADYAYTMGNPRTSSTTYSNSSNGVKTTGTTYGVNPAFNPDMAAKYANYSNQYRAIVLRYMEIKKDMKTTKSNLRNAEKSLLMMARKGYTPSEVEAMETRLNDLFDKVDAIQSQMSDAYKESTTEEDNELFSMLNEMYENSMFLNDFDDTFVNSVLTEAISYDQAVEIDKMLTERYEQNTKKMNAARASITNMKLSIYEKCMNGEITEEQKNELLEKCDKTIEEAGFQVPNRFGSKEEQKDLVKGLMKDKPHVSLDSLEDDEDSEDEKKEESVEALLESSASDADFVTVEEHLNIIEKAISKLDLTIKSVRMTDEQKSEFEKYHNQMAQLLKKAKVIRAALKPLRAEYREAIDDAKEKAKFYNNKKLGGAQNFHYDPEKAKEYQMKYNKYKALDAKFKSLKTLVKEMCKEVKKLNRQLHTLIRKCDGNYSSVEDSINDVMDKIIDAHDAYTKSTVSFSDRPMHDDDFEESTFMDFIVKESMESGEPMEVLIYRSCGEGKITRKTAESLISKLSSVD